MAAIANITPARPALRNPQRRVSQDVRVPIFWGLVILAVFFGGLGTWAALAPLNSAVVGQGELEVASNRKDVQHLEGGIVTEIDVHDGAFVRKGEVLLRLDGTRVAAQLQILHAQRDAALARRARLQAERDDKPAIQFPAALLMRKADPSAEDAMRNEQLLFERRRSSTQGQIQILTQRIGQLREEIRGIQALKASKEQQLALINKELRGVEALFKHGLSTTERLLGLKRTAASLRGDIGDEIASIARADQGIGEAQSQILQTTKNFQEGVAKDIQKTQSELFELAGKIQAAQDIFDHLELRAPTAGYVVGMNAHTVGGVITPGKTVLQIIPSDDALLIETRITPNDADRVKLGDKAQIRFPSIHSRTLPILKGKVVYVSADRLTDERTGRPYFSLRCKLDAHSLAALHKHPLIPGMPAEVIIQTGARTMLDYLVSPITDAFTRSMREK